MGVKHGEKCCRKVDSVLMGEHIGISKWKHVSGNLYGAGEQFGKCAKPNAVLAAANA